MATPREPNWRDETPGPAARPAVFSSLRATSGRAATSHRRAVATPATKSGARPGGHDGTRSTVRAWAQRSEHERRSSPRLELLGAEGVVVLNDRRVPNSKLSINLIAISPAGVFVIDSKNYKGLVHTKRLGPIWDLGPHQLHVGRRNCTSSIEAVSQKVGAVRTVLCSTSWGPQVPVHAVLCLARAEWGYAAAVEVSDVLVGWPKLIAGRLQEPVVMDSPTVREVSQMIAERLPGS